MNKFLTIIVFCLFFQESFAQNAIVNDVQKEGDNLKVFYDLNGSGDFEIKLLITLDNGKTWKGPLERVTGDVGASVFPGTGKKIIWDVLSEGYSLTEKISVRFKIESSMGSQEKVRIKKAAEQEAIRQQRERERIASEEAERIKNEKERKRKEREDRIKKRDCTFNAFGYTFSAITPYNISYNVLDAEDIMGEISIEAGSRLFYDTDYRIKDEGKIYYNGDEKSNFSIVETDEYAYSNLSSKFSLGRKVFWPVFFRYGFYINYMALGDGNRLIKCNVYEDNNLREKNIWVRDDRYQDWGGLCFGADILIGKFILFKNDFRFSVAHWDGIQYNFGLGFVIKKSWCSL